MDQAKVQAAALAFTEMVAGLDADDADCEHTLRALVADAGRVLTTGSLSDFTIEVTVPFDLS